MARSAAARNVRNVLTFGGRIPATVGGLLLAVTAASLYAWIRQSADWAALVPATIGRGEVWRLLSYALVQRQPLDLVFAGLTLYSFAPTLIYAWGERRFLGVCALITVGAALVTLLLGWLLGVAVAYVGIWPLVVGLVLIWSLRASEQQVQLMFVVTITGRTMAILTVAVTALFLAVAVLQSGVAGLVGSMPLAAAVAIAWLLGGGRLRIPPRWRLAWRDWRLERQHRRRSRHLRVVGKNGQRGPNQWLN